jgi:hypothetical protein
MLVSSSVIEINNLLIDQIPNHFMCHPVWSTDILATLSGDVRVGWVLTDRIPCNATYG